MSNYTRKPRPAMPESKPTIYEYVVMDEYSGEHHLFESINYYYVGDELPKGYIITERRQVQ